MEGSNRILPIKSLLENLKQEGKKQYLQLDNKATLAHQHQNNQISTPMTHREGHHNDLSAVSLIRDPKKGISLNKNNDKTSQMHYHTKEPSQVIQQGFNIYVPKRDRNNCEKISRFPNQPPQPFQVDFQPDHFGYANKNNKSQHTIHHPIKQEPKMVSKNSDTTHKYVENMDREPSMLSQKFNSKFQEETRSYSRFEKMESQPIFKDEITKIKTELFRKEALLFTNTQQLEEKERTIKDLLEKLETKEKKGEKIPSQIVERLKMMEYTIKAQQEQIQMLRRELDQSKELYSKYKEDTTTNYTLINLKLRQYEAEERQKSFHIGQLKEKEKKKYQQQEKIIKALKEILKQKEEAIKQTKQLLNASQTKIVALETYQTNKELELLKQLEIKQTFIRQLSAEISDLKTNLRNMEERIREMIDEESEMKEMASNFNEAKTLYKQKQKENEANITELKGKICELNQIIFKRESTLIAYKEKNSELQEKSKKVTQVNRNDSPCRISTSKLIKENERLNTIAKDFDQRLCQFLKLNQALNEQVVKRELMMINISCLSKHAKNNL